MFWPRIKLLIVIFIIISTALFGYQEAAEPQIEELYKRCPKPFEEEFCGNRGMCYVVDTLAVCQCLPGFMGERCDQKYSAMLTEDVPRGYSTETENVVSESTHYTAAVAIVLLVLIVVVIAAILYANTIVNRMIDLTP